MMLFKEVLCIQKEKNINFTMRVLLAREFEYLVAIHFIDLFVFLFQLFYIQSTTTQAVKFFYCRVLKKNPCTSFVRF